MYITCCAGCAKKLGAHYIMDEIPGTDQMGACKLCFQYLHLSQYDAAPRRPRISKARSGGGERARAQR